METQKKRRGDRKDGRLMRELDSLYLQELPFVMGRSGN